LADLRVSLTLSGGASLGAFQAGAVAALLAGFRHARCEEGSDIRIDAIGGASAGSLVGLLAAYSLLEGADGPRLLSRAWVEEVDLAVLQEGDADGPLSLEGVQTRFPALLEDAEVNPDAAQEGPLTLLVQLTGLRGLTYEIAGLREDRPARASTFADWKRFQLDRCGGPEQMVEPDGRSPLDYAITSASHPGAFPPRLMDRGEDRDAYEERGIVDLPDDGMLWYTDGGLVQSEPIGRVVAAAREHGEDAQAAHVNLAIDARSEAPDDASRWGDADGGGGWIEGLSRALAIFPAQALYDDMRRVQRDNDRIGEVDRLVDSLREDLGDERAERVGEQIADLAGVAGKRVVDVDLISPLVMAEETGEDVSELLAGEHMGDFSGFLEEELRRSDFSLGYECGIAWARACLDRFDLDRGVVERSIEAMEEARLYDWDEVRRGDVEPKDLSVRARLRLARMATRAVRALRSSG
jgi:predicted acylesterase/phospholipase RssA